MLNGLICVIAAYGEVPMTQSVVRACSLELAPGHTVVVDNKGDYEAIGDEVVLSRGQKLGWLGGSNVGMAHAFEVLHASAVVLMNNDVTLSRGFFAGMAAAAASSEQVGVVAPCYDDSFKSQHRYWTGPAARFPAQQRDEEVRLVDGTSMLITRRCHELVGPLDALHFGRYGWGATADYCARTSAVGLKVLVTRRAYLNHARAVTAGALSNRYYSDAEAEMEAGLCAKYGPDWRHSLGYGRDGSGTGTLLDRAYYAVRRLSRRC
ncbi:hypothetical protein CLV92_10640 [Kineococcus xinjiangensis]|uniref:GT2 family glycosyltransferase n=1 Tax=Kineococcus xinjiangensis TaxID=512762 RepID=A0A2S6ILX5_9ACTN|nr:glycosyltransferase family 2 protein [Kineococcus xinjiangensis]PPK95219.1 hypothetical protein CLV92_10640 [Kineococcus xinjiangensis]